MSRHYVGTETGRRGCKWYWFSNACRVRVEGDDDFVNGGYYCDSYTNAKHVILNDAGFMVRYYSDHDDDPKNL